MKRPWWLWLRPIVRRFLHPEIPFASFRWWRRLWGGHWEKWYVDPVHCELWMLNEHGTRPGACFGRPQCEDYSMPLTHKQIQAVQALDWLIDEDNRRDGRSIAFAVALIRQALRHPNVRVGYLDHVHAIPSESLNSRGRQLIREYIGGMISADPALQQCGWDLRERDFKAVTEQPVLDWWPSEGVLQGQPPGRHLSEDSPLRLSAWDRLSSEEED